MPYGQPAASIPSMGPRFFNRGNRVVVDGRVLDDYPSMGPRFFNRGNQRLYQVYDSAAHPFNGAAVFQPRKSATTGRTAIASRRLQWGRGFSTAEMNCRALMSCDFSGSLQWGRGFSTAEMVTLPPGHTATVTLQWGRGFSTAEMRINPPQANSQAGPSMGPRFFNRGNDAGSQDGSGDRHPSMGPRFFNRGNPSAGRRHIAWPTTFNGAAVFQPRKLDRLCIAARA